ncbi:hypothetical protein B0H11DRAFT_1929747 [Mycena galericulata]|nr:hypothetical protein B0H11DRAFT_1929747 [Mycena galericulata]
MCAGQFGAQDDVHVREPSRVLVCTVDWAAQGDVRGQVNSAPKMMPRKAMCVGLANSARKMMYVRESHRIHHRLRASQGDVHGLVNSVHKDDGRTRIIVRAGMHYRLGLHKEMCTGLVNSARKMMGLDPFDTIDDVEAPAVRKPRRRAFNDLQEGKKPLPSILRSYRCRRCSMPPTSRKNGHVSRSIAIGDPMDKSTPIPKSLSTPQSCPLRTEDTRLSRLPDNPYPSGTPKAMGFREVMGYGAILNGKSLPKVPSALWAPCLHQYYSAQRLPQMIAIDIAKDPEYICCHLLVAPAAYMSDFDISLLYSQRGNGVRFPGPLYWLTQLYLNQDHIDSTPRPIQRISNSPRVAMLPWSVQGINNEEWRNWPLEAGLPESDVRLYVCYLFAGYIKESLLRRGQDLVQDIQKATCDPLEYRGIKANQFARWFCGFDELHVDGTALPEHVSNGLFALRVLDFVASRLGMPPDKTVRPRPQSLLPVLTGKCNMAMAQLCDWPTVIPKAIKMSKKASSEPPMTSHLWPADGLSDGVSALYTNYMASRWIADKPKKYNTVLKNFHLTAFALGWFFEGRFRIPQDPEAMLTHFESLGFKDRVQKHLPFLTKSGATATNTLRLVLWGSPLFLLVPWSFEDMAFMHHQLIQASRILVLNGNALTTGKVFHWLGSEKPTDLKACETAIMDTVWILAKDGKGAHSVVPDLLCRLEAIVKKSRNWFDTKTSQSVPHPFPSLTKAASIRGKNEKNVEMADHSGQLSISWTSPHLRPSLAQVGAGTRIFEPRPNWTSMDSFGNMLINKRIDEGGINQISIQMESSAYPGIPHMDPFLVSPSCSTIEMGVLSEVQSLAASILGKRERRDQVQSDNGSAPKKAKYRDVQMRGSELNRAKFSFHGITSSGAATIQSRTEIICTSIYAYIRCALSPSTTPEDTLEEQAAIFINIMKCWCTNMKLGQGEQVGSHTSVHLPDIRTWDGLLDVLIVTNLVCFLDVLDRRNDEGLQHTVYCDWASSREQYSRARDTVKDLLTWFTAHYAVKLGGQNINIEENIFQFSAMHFAAVLNHNRFQTEEKQSVLERVLERMGVWVSRYRLVGPTIKDLAGLLPSHWRDSVEYSVHRIHG